MPRTTRSQQEKKLKFKVLGTGHVFSNRQPRDAALKAASRGIKKIRLQEVNPSKPGLHGRIHVFVGSVKKKKANHSGPYVDKEGYVKVSNVKKIGIVGRKGVH